MAELSDFNLGPDIYNALFSSKGFEGFGDGYGGDGYKTNPWMEQDGWNEGSMPVWSNNPTQAALDAFKGYDFNYTPNKDGGGVLNAFDPSGKAYGSYRQKGDDFFTQLVNIAAPALGGWALGGGLSQLFGGGMLGGGLGQGIASGTMSKGMGGSFGSGFLSGAFSGAMNGLAKGTPATVGNNPSAYVPATPGTSVAGMAGITNPTLAGMVNRGVGSTLGGLVSGKSGSEALKSGLIGAGISGLNSVGSNAMNSFYDSLKGWLGPDTSTAGNDAEFDALQGSGGDMSEFTDVSPNRYAEMATGSDGMETYNLDYGFGGDQLANTFSGAPDKSISSVGQFSLPSIFGNVGSSLGNFALNNAGDLASMLYGFYNNRKQQKALGQQISGLQSLYGQNSPYAQQLRNKLNAQAAATGRRSNVAGRETQLQAMLADRNAQMSPHLMQLNQARGQLKNSLGSNTLSMLNKMGAFQGLANMFKPPMGNYSMVNNTNDYNLLGSLEGMR